MSQWGFQDGSSIGEYNTNLISGGAVMVDTRSVRSRQVNDLLSMLAQSIASLRSSYTGKPLQFQHLALYVFLNERCSSGTLSLPLSSLMEMIEGDSYYNDIDLSVKESLAILEDKGLVLNLEDKVHDQSILVLQPYLLLNNMLNAIITSPTSDDGLIEERVFLEALSGIAPQLVSPFLRKFSLCLSLQSPPTLSFGTLSTIAPLKKTPNLFFPSKVTREAPDPNTVGRLFNLMDSYRFGWFIEPSQSLQFPIDILHTIQMEILSLDSNTNNSRDDSEGSAELTYHLWSRGVYCVRGEVQFIVEEQENGEQITVFMSCRPGDEFKLVKQRSELLGMIRRVTDIISDKNEFIISPAHLKSYPLNGEVDLVVHDVNEVASALSEGKDSLTSTDGAVSIKELLYFESYQYFPRPSTIGTSLTNEEEKLSYLESFLSQSSVPESDSVLVSMIATHLLGLSDDAVTEVMAGALGDEGTGATGTSGIVSGLFKKWAQNISCSSFVNNLEEILNQSSIQ
uniref:Death domain-containing protein n=1 Tax=Amphimedon queenslandica TaxID=400682 RepID=A0A1X7TW04_AMPQE